MSSFLSHAHSTPGQLKHQTSLPISPSALILVSPETLQRPGTGSRELASAEQWEESCFIIIPYYLSSKDLLFAQAIPGNPVTPLSLVIGQHPAFAQILSQSFDR